MDEGDTVIRTHAATSSDAGKTAPSRQPISVRVTYERSRPVVDYGARECTLRVPHAAKVAKCGLSRTGGTLFIFLFACSRGIGINGERLRNFSFAGDIVLMNEHANDLQKKINYLRI